MIHDEIGKRLSDDSETTRLDALKKVYIIHLTNVHVHMYNL